MYNIIKVNQVNLMKIMRGQEKNSYQEHNLMNQLSNRYYDDQVHMHQKYFLVKSTYNYVCKIV